MGDSLTRSLQALLLQQRSCEMFKGSGQQLGDHGLPPHLSPHLRSPGARAGPGETREQQGSLSMGPSPLSSGCGAGLDAKPASPPPYKERGHLSWVACFPFEVQASTSRTRVQCSGHFHQQRRELGFGLDAHSAVCRPSFPRKYSLNRCGLYIFRVKPSHT